MNPGKLGKRIEIMTHGECENRLGATVHAPILFKSVRASIKAKARSAKQADADNERVNYTITIRYIPFLDTTMSIIYQGKELEIVELINVNEENKYIEITAIYKG